MSCAAALCLLGALAVDGDTIKHRPDPNIRIFGIDAPEMRDPGGPQAKAALSEMIAGQELSCTPRYFDKYDRLVAVCLLPDGRDIACEMVKAGHAHDWEKYSGGRYRECER